jgi:PAS domain S-box-containing protein
MGMPVRKKLLLILALFSLLPMTFIGVMSFVYAKNELIEIRYAKLTAITDRNLQKLNDFFIERKMDLLAARAYPNIKYYISSLMKCFQEPSDPICPSVKKEFDDVLRKFQFGYHYTNVIISASNGDIVYIQNELGQSEHTFQNSLGSLARKIIEDREDVYFSDILPNPMRDGQFVILAAAPIYNTDKKLTANLVFEINMSPVYDLIQDLTGLGETGETLIAKKNNGEILFLNPLRHDSEAALKRTAQMGDDQAIPIQQALQGINGHGLSTDYRGENVVAVWRRIPMLGWGAVTKIDASEAFYAVNMLRNSILVIAFTFVGLSIIVSLLVAKKVSDPIEKLQLGVKEVGRGNLDHRVGMLGRDEIGMLGRAFDKMTARLKSITATKKQLDREIIARKNIEKELKNNLAALGERIKELNCLFEISRLIDQHPDSLEDILQGIVGLISPAFRFPDIAAVRINMNNQLYETDNFVNTDWQLTQEIIIKNSPIGNLTVVYLEKRPTMDEGPFLKEERDLVKAITERLGKIYERVHAQDGLISSEKRFRDLVEYSLTGISIVQNDQVVFQNQAQERLVGPLPRSFLLNSPEMIHPNDVEKVKPLSKMIENGQIQKIETDFRFYPDGEFGNDRYIKWVNCRAISFDYQGKQSLLVNLVDLTQAKELERLLGIQDKMASLGRVAAGIAHEIRNPLSGINIYLNTLKRLLGKDNTDEKQRLILDQVQSASQKIEMVIRRVMDFARPSEPKLELTDINQPLMEAIKLISVTLRKSGIILEQSLADNLPLIQADKNLIEETVLNLLNNAAAALRSKKEGKKIRVSSLVEKKHIVIQICDSGPGIPIKIRDKIFDPYFTTKPEGTGIGLSISSRIIKDHGGSIIASDCNLGGAEFRIELPINFTKL